MALKKIKILFLDILTDDPKARKIVNKQIYRGTYSEATRKAFGLRKDQWLTVYASKEVFPKKLDFDALIMGGSFENPVGNNDKSWMKKTYAFIRLVIKNQIPILGICGGLQFTVRALGGQIMFNPKGKEFGSITLSTTESGKKDLLFRGFSKKFPAQESHKCMLKNFKRGWKLLASSEMCKPQAIAINSTVRLLQFHPEMQISYLKGYAKWRKEAFTHPP